MGSELARAVINGILGGGIYALMAVGLTLIFGVLDIINIAQGVMVMLGAYLSYALSVHLHLDLFLGLLITIPAMFVIGVIIQVAFIRPLHGSERTSMSLLASYAVAIVIEGALVPVLRAELRDAQRLLRHQELHPLRFPASVHRPVRLRHGCRAGGRHLPAAVPDQIRPQRPRHHAGQNRRHADRGRREQGRGARPTASASPSRRQAG